MMAQMNRPILFRRALMLTTGAGSGERGRRRPPHRPDHRLGEPRVHPGRLERQTTPDVPTTATQRGHVGHRRRRDLLSTMDDELLVRRARYAFGAAQRAGPFANSFYRLAIIGGKGSRLPVLAGRGRGWARLRHRRRRPQLPAVSSSGRRRRGDTVNYLGFDGHPVLQPAGVGDLQVLHDGLRRAELRDLQLRRQLREPRRCCRR